MPSLTGLLREMACGCHGGTAVTAFYVENGEVISRKPDDPRCARCQALALAKEQERQLAAAQAQVDALRSWASHLRGCAIWHDADCSCGLMEALANSTAALDEHDERVRREALESAADAQAAMYTGHDPDSRACRNMVCEGCLMHEMFERWLRERAKATQ